MPSINPYLTFPGNCEEAFNFYKVAFGGEFLFLGRYKDLPPSEREKFKTIKDEQIMHVSLPISKEIVLMGCDSPESGGKEVIAGNNISLSLNTENPEQADSLFAQLSQGGEIKMPMTNTFWGAYFGMLADKFGINWMINCEEKAEIKYQ
jgi:PhnB protein